MVARRIPVIPVWVLVVLFLGAGLAGCLDADDGPDAGEDGTAGREVAPWAVVALVDTGINPYHVDFRLTGELADVHPSEYIPGYPEDVETVELTFDAQDLEAALKADEETWASLEPETPYWFKGTRVTGISFGSADEDVGPVWSTGHGTMVASKAGGGEHSLCPTCHVVGVQGFNADGVKWSAEQDWIDVQSNSWGPSPAFAWADPVVGNDPELNDVMREAAARQAVFVAAGNGIAGGLGVVGFPSPTDTTSGPPGVIAVGGNDNGRVTLWSAWLVHVVADACWNWAAVGNTIEEFSPRAGGGTSAASPYTAGAAARLILEARAFLNATEVRDPEAGVFARAPDNASLPSSGPLADGDFTLEELKRVLFATASPVPRPDDASGDVCPVESPYHSTLQWGTLPEETPRFAWVGYGSVEAHSLQRAVAVLSGGTELPDRGVEDEYYARDQQLRETYHSVG